MCIFLDEIRASNTDTHVVFVYIRENMDVQKIP
jgi:hypothetical protein